MDVKPLFEEEGYKPTSRKYVPPTHNRQHPRDGLFSHQSGDPINGRGAHYFIDKQRGVNVAYGQRGESIKSSRATVCGLRDKMAGAGSSAKMCRLTSANGHVDRRIDSIIPASALIPPKPRRKRNGG